MKFTEEQLENTFIKLLEQEGYPHTSGETLVRSSDEVIIEEDLREFLTKQYRREGITEKEINSIILRLKTLPTSDLYESNKTFMNMFSDGFILKREDRKQKDLYIQLLDYSELNKQHQPLKEHLTHIWEDAEEANYKKDGNKYRFVNQLEITGSHKRIPDGILYINGLPIVVFEFKSAIREEATIHDAYKQLTTRYKRDIPQLFLYNAFCVISDGVNSKAGSFFASYDFYYAWRRIAGMGKDVDGIDAMFTMIRGMFHKKCLRDIIQNFIYFPDSSKKEVKILCRYPQYYAANALFESIKKAQKPNGDGKGGIYFGATGSGKSYTMLYLARLLMRSEYFESPTIILITDRTDLDTQLSEQFVEAKKFIGDNNIVSVESRADLREKLQGRKSGGVFLTTIHKFTEDIKLLSERSNIICISDEAHRSQTNLDQKITVTSEGVKKTYGFAKYLHDSLPNAVYVGFTGTPIEASLDVFGKVTDIYTMNESVRDEITVSIVYEGRAAKVALNNSELERIEEYYREAEEGGANEYQIDKSQRSMATLTTILGNPDRLQKIAEDFIEHYETRIHEGASIVGKTMFVASSREIAYDLYQRIIALRPAWKEIKVAAEGAVLTDKEKRELKPIERIRVVATRGKDDPEEMYNHLGTKEDRKDLEQQFKEEKSNFKIAIVVDMWLTGFDVPFLDTMYIDKAIRQHNLIQTISRVNRKFKGKNKGLIVDYIGFKRYMNQALKRYGGDGEKGFEGVEQAVIAVRNQLDLLDNIFYKFDTSAYFEGTPLGQLNTLNDAAEHVQKTKEIEKRFMDIVRRLKAAYDICVGSEKLTQKERDWTHFYLAVRSIVFKLTRGSAPDVAQMNKRVQEMINDALQSNGVEEILKIGEEESQQDIFDEEYLERIDKIKLPNTKIKLLQQLLAKAIGEIKKVNRVKGIDFSKKMETLVKFYNERKEDSLFDADTFKDIAEQMAQMIRDVAKEFNSGDEIGLTFEEKSFYDILLALCMKFDFEYPEEKLIELAKAIKEVVDDISKYPDWNTKPQTVAELEADLIILMDKFGYPPVAQDEAYKEILEQAANYKKNSWKN